MSAEISLSWALFYLLSSRRASEAIKPNKLRLRWKHRPMQHVWLPRYVGEQLDLIFRYVGCLLSDFSSFICSGRNFFFGKLKEEKKSEFYSIQLGRFPTTCISNSQSPCLFKKKNTLGSWQVVRAHFSHTLLIGGLHNWLPIGKCRWMHKIKARWSKMKRHFYLMGAERSLI